MSTRASGTGSSFVVPEAGGTTLLKPAKVSPWGYSETEDSMGRKLAVAYIHSTNTLSFAFPYQGDQKGEILIRKRAGQGSDVIFTIEKGQFMCHSEDCTVNVRFDEGPVRTFPAGGAADGSTTVLFIQNKFTFLAEMQKAKTLRLEAVFYHEGSKTLNFNVEGFKWPK